MGQHIHPRSRAVKPPVTDARASTLEFSPPRSLPLRVMDAFWRRGRALWNSGNETTNAAQAALDWLLANTAEQPWLSSTASTGPSGAEINRWLEIGQLDIAVARAGLGNLGHHVPHDGSLSAAANRLEGLLAILSRMEQILAASSTSLGTPAAWSQRDETPHEFCEIRHRAAALARREAERIAGRIDATGNIRWPDLPGSLDPLAPAAVQLAIASPLLSAAERFHRDDWQQRAQAVIRGMRRHYELARIDAAPAIVVVGIRALRAVGLVMEARAALTTLDATIRQGATRHARVLSDTRVIAELAELGYVLDESEIADAWYQQLAPRQSRCGSLSDSMEPADEPIVPSTMATLGFLAASLARVAAHFQRETRLPSEIDESDGRLLAMQEWLRSVPPGGTLLDAGCGPGRFLREIARHRPDLSLVGVDGSPRFVECLRETLPSGVLARTGSLLRLPAATGEFDAVLCVEALEHALLPRVAVGELARVTRAGGTILIIDKDHQRLALSRHEPWERWFGRDEVATWLNEYGFSATATSLEHGDPRLGSGLFFGWTAERRSERIQKPPTRRLTVYCWATISYYGLHRHANPVDMDPPPRS